MKQLVQSIRQGSVEVLDVPAPQLRGLGVIVRTAASMISAGTERAALEFAKASLLDKGRSRPDLVKQVIQTVQRDGFFRALNVRWRAWTSRSPPGTPAPGLSRASRRRCPTWPSATAWRALGPATPRTRR